MTANRNINWIKKHMCALAWMIMLSFYGFLLLLIAYGNHSDSIFFHYLLSGKILLLNIAPVLIAALFIFSVSGSYFISFFLSTSAATGFCLANYYKICFRDDPILFEDLLLIREASVMAGNYDFFVNWRIVVILLGWFVANIFIFLFCREKIKSVKLRMRILMVGFLLSILFSFLYQSDTIYASIGTDAFWEPTEYAVSRGGLYPFLHSIYNENEKIPENYNSQNIQNLLSEYPESDIPSDRKVNIIALMREAYVDFSAFNINGLDCSEYDIYHEIKESSYTGRLVTNIFAGGTVDTERCFLTGAYKLKNYRMNTNSYVWYLRRQGYTTEGSHPFFQRMYNRRNINQYLGFEKYRYYENDFEYLSSEYYPEDRILFSEIYNDFQKSKENNKPCFSFSVNVQSHGPYSTNSYRNGSKEYLTGDYSDECKYAMNNYMNITMEQDRELKIFLDALAADQEPVVFILFSDHLPWMGNGNSFYSEMGIEFQTETEAGFYDYYATEYLIWANAAAKEILENSFTGNGPTISPCYLMNEVFKQCGWKGPAYMQAMNETEQIFPVITTNGRYVADGLFTDTIPENRIKTMQTLESLDYYWRNNFLYP